MCWRWVTVYYETKVNTAKCCSTLIEGHKNYLGKFSKEDKKNLDRQERELRGVSPHVFSKVFKMVLFIQILSYEALESKSTFW